jgi:hypothetical protein
MFNMIQKGYWVVLLLHAVLHQPHLKLVPAGVIPQRERRPRPIMDYTYNDVNTNSLPLAPDLLQFGHTLTRLMQRISYADPQHGPVHISKLDLADGYYRVKLSPEAALELAVVLPGATPSAKNLIGIPLMLPMGWKYSPNYFCTHSETATDLANLYIQTQHPLPPHPLELPSQAMTVPTVEHMSPSYIPPPTLTAQPPVAYVDVYMDNFLGLAQRDTTSLVLRALLHGVSHIFRHDHHIDAPPVRHPPNWKREISSGPHKRLSWDGCWIQHKALWHCLNTNYNAFTRSSITFSRSDACHAAGGTNFSANFAPWRPPSKEVPICSLSSNMFWSINRTRPAYASTP